MVVDHKVSKSSNSGHRGSFEVVHHWDVKVLICTETAWILGPQADEWRLRPSLVHERAR